MLSKSAILKAIERRYSRYEPMNITAMYRHDRDLLDAAFFVRPFLGWYGAIAAAGIDYGEIEIELSEYVVCQICGKECRAVINHVIHGHGVSVDDYIEEYPYAELQSDLTRARRCRFDEGTFSASLGTVLDSGVYSRSDLCSAHHGLPSDFQCNECRRRRLG